MHGWVASNSAILLRDFSFYLKKNSYTKIRLRFTSEHNHLLKDCNAHVNHHTKTHSSSSLMWIIEIRYGTLQWLLIIEILNMLISEMGGGAVTSAGSLR
jgi:hypothetical protein